MRSACAILVLLAGAAVAAETAPAVAPPPSPAAEAPSAPSPTKAKPAAEPSASAVPEEERWNFEPPAGRPDIFVDLEARLMLEKKQETVPSQGAPPPVRLTAGQDGQLDAAIAWARNQAGRIEALVLARRWDEAMQESDTGAKSLEKYASNAVAKELIDRFKGYRQQAEEAKIYEEAQAKFDALGLKVEGILWAPEGSLAVISGEPRALKINERAKDCVIINIDTNRVDFLFHHNRRRFEFQRYVGEEVRAAVHKARGP